MENGLKSLEQGMSAFFFAAALLFLIMYMKDLEEINHEIAKKLYQSHTVYMEWGGTEWNP